MKRLQRIISSTAPILTATTLLHGCVVLGFSSICINRKRVPVFAEAFDGSPTVSDTARCTSSPSPTAIFAASPFDNINEPVDDTTTSSTTTTTTPGANKQDWMQAVRASRLEAYHLIWSRGAMKKMAIGTTSLALADMLFSIPAGRHLARTAMTWMSRSSLLAPISNLASNVALPLLASSCCLLQLGINLLAGGCAGFNTVLGPIRPYFLSLLLYSTAVTHQVRRAQWYRLTALRWGIALLPEVIDVWNRYQERPRAEKLFSKLNAPNTLKATVKLDIPTMGCVACINKIDSALRNADTASVVEAAAFLNPLGAKGGQATVRLVAESREEVDQLVESLVRSVESAGFEPCRLEALEIDA